MEEEKTVETERAVTETETETTDQLPKEKSEDEPGSTQLEPEESDSFEVSFEDGTKKTLTATELERALKAEDDLKVLREKHKAKIDEASALKSRLAEHDKSTQKETVLGDKDLEFTIEDLQDSDALQNKLNKISSSVKEMRTRLAEASDPVKRAEEIESFSFRNQVEAEIKSDPLLSKMKQEGARAMARDAIAWAIEQNEQLGREEYDTPGKAIAGYKESLGLVVSNNTKKVDRQMKRITSILKAPGETVSGGKSVPGNIGQKYMAMTQKERINFEKNLDPDESRKLSIELARMDSG